MGNLGIFEADANAVKLSAEAAAKNGFELEESIDRAIFRTREQFGAYLANAQSKADFEERWTEVKPKVIKVVAEVVKPTPGILRRIGAALKPAQAQAVQAKKERPASTNTEPTVKTAAVQKTAWDYDKTTKLWKSSNPMQRFACPGCGTEQAQLGFTHCAGCDRTWNSWPVRQAGSEKTASTYVLMAREIKMRGDQFKLAAQTNVEAGAPPVVKEAEVKVADAPLPQEPPPGVAQPNFGTMPGDNSGAMGAPMPPEQPPVPGDRDGDGDLAGGVTEDSPIDQIQDALQDAVMALKDVQMLSVNPALMAMGSNSAKKVETLRESMNRFWGLHKQMNYIAGMLAKEANEALRQADPRIVSEAEFVAGYTAASKNEPLPAKTGKAWLEGYVAFHAQGNTYDTGVDSSSNYEPAHNDESPGARNEGSYLNGGLDDSGTIQSDAGPFDTSQPAQREFASQMDADNAAGANRAEHGQADSIQPTSAVRRTVPKGRK